MNDIVAVILAGGSGSRFWPLSNKVLFPFMGKTFFELSVGTEVAKIAKKIIIVATPKNKTSFSQYKTIIQEKPTGMADAILSAEKEIGNGPVLIINGDDISDPKVFDAVLARAQSLSAFGVVPAYKVDTYQDLGYLDFDNGKVRKIIEKPGDGKEPSNMVFMISYFVRESSELFGALRKTNDHEQALTLLMQKNVFEMYEYKGSFASLKYPWHVLSAMSILFKNLKSNTGKNVVIKKNVVIEGNVYIGDNVIIYENTKIIGPCYIGANTIIGNNNIIRESHIGANCVTGFNTDITRSYIGASCWFHSNYIGDSVLEGNVGMGSGAVLANLRLDEGEIFSTVKNQRVNTGRNKFGAIIGRDVRIGVNSSVMPGVKIGSGSMIGAGVTLEKDIPDSSFCMLTNGSYTITKNTRKPTRSRDKFKKHI